MITGQELTRMRETADMALPETAIIARKVRTPDGAGGSTIAMPAVGTSPCRVSRPGKSINLEILAGRITNRVVKVLTFPAGADVREGDRVTVAGVEHEILSVLDGTWEISRQVIGVVV